VKGSKARQSSVDNRESTVVMVRASDPSVPNSLVVTVPDSGANVESVERALIAFALERTGGNRTRAASFLGLSRSALIYRIHKHGLVAWHGTQRHDLRHRGSGE
jgi:DNA-binding NtrC family response regulator